MPLDKIPIVLHFSLNCAYRYQAYLHTIIMVKELGSFRGNSEGIRPSQHTQISIIGNGRTYITQGEVCASLVVGVTIVQLVNSLRPRQNRCHYAYDVFKCSFSIENVWIPIKISLKFVPKGPINNIPVLVHIMAWRRPGDKPLSEPMMVRLPTHICVTRPQWV